MYIPQIDNYEREHLDENTLALLCDFALGDPAHPLQQLEVDWKNVFEAVCRNGLLGLTYLYLAANETNTYPPEKFRQSVIHTYRLTALRMALIYRAVVRVLQTLNEAGMHYLIVKGPAAAYTLYPDPAARSFNDLDIVVRQQDWGAIHQLLTEMGFEQEENLPQLPPKIIPETVPYETTYWNAKSGLKVEVHYDDILNSGFAARDIDGFWQRAITLEVRGVLFKTLSVEDQLIHLCAHVHYHGYVKLSWFADLALLLRQYGDQLDWGRVLRVVETEEAHVPIYYSLYFLERRLGVQLAPGVLDKLKPGRLRRWLHDRYMPPDQIISFQPTPRPDFSFYFLPLYKRMLPDLLVMGRRKEKFHYLLRLLFPPRDWLRFYYGLTNGRWLPLHYLLHPLRLLGIYVRETIQVIATGQYVDYNTAPHENDALASRR